MAAKWNPVESTSPYHHGNLRRALLDASWQLAREQGVDALSLRAVARRVGVSHAAPAHHFPDKAALVEALAVEGYQRFAAALQSAWDRQQQDCLQRLAAVGFAYIRFAQQEKDVFQLMNRPELRTRGEGGWSSSVGAAARESYGVLERGVRLCQDEGLIPSGDPEPWTLLAWSGVHGLAVLILDELLPTRVESLEQGTELTQHILAAMGHGLFVRDSPLPVPSPPST